MNKGDAASSEETMVDPLYRTGARYPVMIAWTVFVVLAFLIVVLSLSVKARVEFSPRLIAVGVGVVLIGPCCLVFYLLRRRFVFVHVDDEKGLFLRGRDLLPWAEIRSVEAFAGPLGLGTQKGPVRLPSSGRILHPGTMGDVIDRAMRDTEGDSGGILLYCLLMPVISIFSPWHPKVVIKTTDRRRLVFHELERDLEFCLRCVPRIREQRRKERPSSA